MSVEYRLKQNKRSIAINLFAGFLSFKIAFENSLKMKTYDIEKKRIRNSFNVQCFTINADKLGQTM